MRYVYRSSCDSMNQGLVGEEVAQPRGFRVGHGAFVDPAAWSRANLPTSTALVCGCYQPPSLTPHPRWRRNKINYFDSCLSRQSGQAVLASRRRRQKVDGADARCGTRTRKNYFWPGRSY